MQYALVLSKGERIHHPLNNHPLSASASYAFQNLDFFQYESFKELKYFKASIKFLKLFQNAIKYHTKHSILFTLFS